LYFQCAAPYFTNRLKDFTSADHPHRSSGPLWLFQAQLLPHLLEEFMAKTQKHGNREFKKPKKKKETVSAPVISAKIAGVLNATPKKRI
jgi:hypothetical protein